MINPCHICYKGNPNKGECAAFKDFEKKYPNILFKRAFDYGFSGSRSFSLSFSALFNNKNPLKLPVAANIVINHNQSSYWDGVISPNSESTIITPGVGIMGNLGNTSYSINLQKPIKIGFPVLIWK